MTNHWIDFQNSDCILIMGSNPAANHPVSFKWITKAVEKGATLICVDPRFTQSAAKAHIYAPLRSGTDIAFLGGMIKYILDNNLIQEEYVKNYTNAAFLVNPAFKLPGDNGGVFSGLKGEAYDKATWSYQTDAEGKIKKDGTLQDPHCVYQLLKKQYSRYTPEMVSRITGTPKEKLLEVYRAFAQTGRPDKAGNILYAMGWTQHTVGTQNIRAMSIIQELLGNMGIAGGGVQALRGESNVQGSTDHGLLFHILPGYLGVPRASDTTLAVYNEQTNAQNQRTQQPQLVEKLPQIQRQSVALLLRSERHPGRGLFLPAQTGRRRRLLVAVALRPDVQGKVQRLFCLGDEPGRQRRQHIQGAKGPDTTGLAGQRQSVRQRNRRLLARTGHGSEENKDGSVHAALRRLLREGGEHHEQRTADAMAQQGRRTAGRGEAGRRDHHRSLLPDQGIVRKGRAVP